MPRAKDISTAAAALRDSFGDRKIPDISRKITACVACRKLKIKCEIADAEQPCARCKARGLSCTVNRSLQMLLESDAEWKDSMERRVEVLERRVPEGLDGAVVGRIPNYTVINGPPDGITAAPVSTRNPLVPPNDATPGLPTDLGAFPATSPQQDDRPIMHPPAEGELDLISAGLVSQKRAKQLVSYFQEHLNHHLHYIIDPRTTLPELRSRSTLLVAAVCTVAALCSESTEYAACLGRLKHDISGKLFAPKYSFDEVRALCIASMWLDALSATLGGMAVRISAQLNLHRCISKMPHSKAECYERTRLYYQVSLCDHHCSLKHGRPPMTQEWRSLQAPGAFLHSEHSQPADIALISQIELWTISRRVFETFGADTGSDGAKKRLADIAQLDTAYQNWRRLWLETMAVGAGRNRHYESELYYQEARLILFSHGFRGSQPSDGRLDSNAAGYVGGALQSATAVIRMMVDEIGGKKIIGLPCYHGTMVAYATAYLLKTATGEMAADVTSREECRQLLRSLAKELDSFMIPTEVSRPLLDLKGILDSAMRNMPQSRAPQNEAEGMDFSFDPTLLSDDLWNMDFTFAGDDWLQCWDH